MFKKLLNIKTDKGIKASLVTDSNKPGISIEQQIHNDMYSAHDSIIKEAYDILSSSSNFFSKEKIERLQKLKELGFTNFDEIQILEKELEKSKKYSELHRVARYYNKVYPFHKFICQDTVKRIIKKYGLVLARVRDYIADIPDKNQKEIVGFKVMRKDIREPDEVYRGFSIQPFFMDVWDDSTLDMIRIQRQNISPEEYFKIKKRNEYIRKKEIDRELLSGNDLLIIAPVNKIDMIGKYVKDGIVTEDPIVLQPVNGGYLIVTSWGLEASDPEVVNHKFN